MPHSGREISSHSLPAMNKIDTVAIRYLRG
jgi:hypothetical protein